MSSKYVVIPNIFTLVSLLGGISSALANQSVHLNWMASSSPEVAGYNVYYGSDSGVYTMMVSPGAATTLNVDDLTDGMTYYFAVTAYDSGGSESAPSNEASYVVPGIAPPRGGPFVAQALPYNSITLAWDPSPSADIQGYLIRYGTQSGVYDNTLWVTPDTQADIHYLADGTTYYFTVIAVNGSGLESSPAPELSYLVPEILPPQNAPTLQQIFPSPTVTLSWTPSPSANVAGYRVYYGTQYGVYENYFDVGASQSVDVSGLVEGQSYFFAIAAYSVFGTESVWSYETWHYFAPTAVIDPGVVLSLQQMSVPGFPNAFSITATGVIPASWTLEGSSDLQKWRTLATGDESEINVAVVVSEKPALFFRLSSWYEGMELARQSEGPDRYPDSFVVTTPYYVPWDWTLESSEDLQNWSPLATGFFAPVKVAIVHAPTPRMFFRLKSG